jgi:hypothetical protein
LPLLAPGPGEHERLAGADHDILADVVAVEHGLAVGIKVEAVAKPSADFADGHVAHGQLLGVVPAGDGDRQSAIRCFIEEGSSAAGTAVAFVVRTDAFVHR